MLPEKGSGSEGSAAFCGNFKAAACVFVTIGVNSQRNSIFRIRAIFSRTTTKKPLVKDMDFLQRLLSLTYASMNPFVVSLIQMEESQEASKSGVYWDHAWLSISY